MKSWALRKSQIALGGRDDKLNHIIWCDHIWCVAKSLGTCKIMSQELTDAIYRARYKWKHSSLQVLLCVCLCGQDMDFDIASVGIGSLQYLAVGAIKVYGGRIYSFVSLLVVLDHRLAKAEGVF